MLRHRIIRSRTQTDLEAPHAGRLETGTGRVSGEQMLTVGRGLRTTATAAVGPG